MGERVRTGGIDGADIVPGVPHPNVAKNNAITEKHIVIANEGYLGDD